jgi:hypothetical protein
MDAGRIRVQAAALVRKRGHAVAHAQPELAIALGSRFGAAFAAYASTGPTPGGGAADAEAFARYLRDDRQAWPREVRRAARRVAGFWPAGRRRARPGASLPESLV